MLFRSPETAGRVAPIGRIASQSEAECQTPTVLEGGERERGFDDDSDRALFLMRSKLNWIPDRCVVCCAHRDSFSSPTITRRHSITTVDVRWARTTSTVAAGPYAPSASLA